VATGYFEIGGLLGLKDEWQKVDEIRILMGDEVSQRTRKAFAEGLTRVKSRLDGSLEKEKEQNDFLSGVPAIVEAIRSGKTRCRVYRKDKFHAKAYITHGRQEVVGSFALVGSSNLTLPGITENVELNVQISGTPVTVLQEWYEEHWDAAEDVTEEILRVIERHTQEYLPFDVYAKALQEYFRAHEMTTSEWERQHSKIYPILAKYQCDAYHDLMKKAQRYNGAFLCDGVGLGKTFVGLMLIERLVIHDRKSVALFVPKARPQAGLGGGDQAVSAAAVREIQQPGDLQPHRPVAGRRVSRVLRERQAAGARDPQGQAPLRTADFLPVCLLQAGPETGPVRAVAVGCRLAGFLGEP
jgi:HKD family nuclease